MSQPNNHHNSVRSPDPSGDFGLDEGVAGYAMLAFKQPDRTVSELAEKAVRIQMLVNGRFDVDPRIATEAVVAQLRPASMTVEDVARRVTEYYDRDESEFQPADPEEMTLNIRDIIQAAKDKRAED